MSTKSISEQALELPGRERANLAKTLLESLRSESEEAVEDAWIEEVERRAEEVLSGDADLEDWSDVRSRLMSRVRSKTK